MAGDKQFFKLFASQSHDHRTVQERVEVDDVLDRNGTCWEEIIAHTAIVLEGDVAVTLFLPGIAHHQAQGVITVNVAMHLGNHAFHFGAALEMREQRIGSLAAACELVQKNVFSLLAYHFAAFDFQGRERDTRHLITVLGNQYAIVHFAAFELGVGMAADDEVVVWKLLSQLNVHIIAHMGEQHVDIALRREPFILRNDFFGLLECQSLYIVGTRVRDAQSAHLRDA